jgi:hypothetical protein
MVLVSMASNDWRLIYPLDDTYIHMAIAKNLALHGVWGVTPYGFTWSTSSPLWTALLGLGYRIFGVSDALPLILNAVLATLFCVTAYFLLARRGLEPSERLIALLLLIFLTSIPSLVMVGMEHVLQLYVVCVFIYFAAESLSNDHGASPLLLVALAPIVSTSRYEGLFLIAPVVGLFLIRRRFAAALLIAGAAVLPVVGLGIWSIEHGWRFLPNSLLIKGNLPTASAGKAVLQFVARIVANIIRAPWLDVMGFAAAIALAGALKSRGSIWSWPGVALTLYLTMMATDIALARTGWRWFSRYDAYMIAAGIFIFGCIWREPYCRQLFARLNPPRLTFASRALRFVVALALLPRAVAAVAFIPHATHLVYEQQYQVARFVKDFYSAQTVALNDIGVVDYEADIKVIDVAGLATMAVADAMRTNRFDLAAAHEAGKIGGMQIGIVYTSLFPARPPRCWIEVGTWQLPKSAALGSSGFTFYGYGDAQAERLRSNLEAFQTRLPAPIKTSFVAAYPGTSRAQRDQALAGQSSACGDGAAANAPGASNVVHR